MEQYGTKRTREEYLQRLSNTEKQNVLRYRRGRAPEIDPEDVADPNNDPKLRHSFNVNKSFNLNITGIVSGSAPPVPSFFSIGNKFIVVYNPTVSPTYLFVAGILQAGSKIDCGLNATNNYLPIYVPPATVYAEVNFPVPIFVPLYGPTVRAVSANIAESGPGLPTGLEFPFMTTCRTTSARITTVSTASSITATPLVGNLFAGKLSMEMTWLAQTSRLLPPYLYQSCPDKENTLQSVATQDGITIAVENMDVPETCTTSSTCNGTRYKGDAFRYQSPIDVNGPVTNGVEAKAAAEFTTGQFNGWISPGGMTGYNTSPPFTGGSQTGVALIGAPVVPPGFLPRFRCAFGVSAQSVSSLGLNDTISTLGNAFFYHFFMALQQDNAAGAVPYIVTAQDAVAISCVEVAPVALTLTAIGSTTFCTVKSAEFTPEINAYPGFPPSQLNTLLWIGTGVRLCWDDTVTDSERFYLTELSVEVEGIVGGGTGRGQNAFVVYGETSTTQTQQEFTVSGNIDVEGTAGLSLAQFTGTTESSGKVNFFRTAQFTK